MKKVLGVVGLLLIFASVAEANLSVVCIAKGKKTANNGGGMLYTDARISFDAEDPNPDNNLRTIAAVNGVIKVADVNNESELNENNAYIGKFKFEELNSNPKYRPVKYKNMVQFQNFDAKETMGEESGMWGQFLIDKEFGDGCDAKYIFQAGDHMGGTINFKCTVRD
jgi:hypothetical protein